MKLNPYTSIWTHPIETLRSVETHRQDYHAWILAAAMGIGQLIMISSFQNLGDRFPIEVLLGTAIVFGPAWGLMQLVIQSYLIYRTGKWLGGQASLRQVRLANGLYLIPNLLAFLLTLPAISTLGIEYFTKEKLTIELQSGIRNATQVTEIANMLLVIWSIIMLCRMLSDVQGFGNRWKAFGNVLLANVLAILILSSISMVLSILL